MQSSLIQELIEAFRVLPGVGPKSAQRMTYQLLEKNRQGGKVLADVLTKAIEEIGHCEHCRTLSEKPVCDICESSNRDNGELCVVESPSDIAVIEQSGIFQGKYFVLMGHLSPIDGIGPQELGLDELSARLAQGDLTEMIVSLNPSVEAEATIHYLQKMAADHGVKVTRLAQGIPFGGELEYVDSGTLTQAFISRQEV